MAGVSAIGHCRQRPEGLGTQKTSRGAGVGQAKAGEGGLGWQAQVGGFIFAH